MVIGSAAALAFCAAPARAAEPDWLDQLRIGTASPGGTYYVYGEALAKILTRALDLPVERLATEGAVQNIELMEAGEARIGTGSVATLTSRITLPALSMMHTLVSFTERSNPT